MPLLIYWHHQHLQSILRISTTVSMAITGSNPLPSPTLNNSKPRQLGVLRDHGRSRSANALTTTALIGYEHLPKRKSDGDAAHFPGFFTDDSKDPLEFLDLLQGCLLSNAVLPTGHPSQRKPSTGNAPSARVPSHPAQLASPLSPPPLSLSPAIGYRRRSSFDHNDVRTTLPAAVPMRTHSTASVTSTASAFSDASSSANALTSPSSKESKPDTQLLIKGWLETLSIDDKSRDADSFTSITAATTTSSLSSSLASSSTLPSVAIRVQSTHQEVRTVEFVTSPSTSTSSSPQAYSRQLTSPTTSTTSKSSLLSLLDAKIAELNEDINKSVAQPSRSVTVSTSSAQSHIETLLSELDGFGRRRTGSV
ncbi:hypothetical protein BC832DRAFT_85460 [Gaertneriomyces semiglobifer]|nr:hypothetical protein BC832DRAFT_85460 [Gaertneriomyces semiglobifer]